MSGEILAIYPHGVPIRLVFSQNDEQFNLDTSYPRRIFISCQSSRVNMSKYFALVSSKLAWKVCSGFTNIFFVPGTNSFEIKRRLFHQPNTWHDFKAAGVKDQYLLWTTIDRSHLYAEEKFGELPTSYCQSLLWWDHRSWSLLWRDCQHHGQREFWHFTNILSL